MKNFKTKVNLIWYIWKGWILSKQCQVLFTEGLIWKPTIPGPYPRGKATHKKGSGNCLFCVCPIKTSLISSKQFSDFQELLYLVKNSKKEFEEQKLNELKLPTFLIIWSRFSSMPVFLPFSASISRDVPVYSTHKHLLTDLTYLAGIQLCRF